MPTDDQNLQRSIWGDALHQQVHALTNTERENTFGDGVAYMLHAEIARMVQEGEKTAEAATLWAEDIAGELLMSALRSFVGDHEDGPWVWEEEPEA